MFKVARVGNKMLSYFERLDESTEWRNGNLQISRRVSTIFSHNASDVPASGLILTLANTRMIFIAVSSTVPEDPKSTLSSSVVCLSFSLSLFSNTFDKLFSPIPLPGVCLPEIMKQKLSQPPRTNIASSLNYIWCHLEHSLVLLFT